MDDIRPGHPLHGVGVVADKQNHRHPVAIRAVYRHRRVLQPDRAIRINGHRFTFNFEVAVRHCNGGLFMKAGQKLRVAVHSVVDR